MYKLRVILPLLASLGLVACATTPAYQKAVQAPKGSTYKVGKPYQVFGRWYYPKEDLAYNQVGIASWYGPQFHKLTTANGELFDMNELTAAHTTLPMPSFVRVTNLENGRAVILRVNDRGPFVGDRLIDVSRRAAQLLGFDGKGTAKVRVEAVTPLGSGAPIQEAKVEPPHNPENGPIMPAAPAPAVEKSQLAELAPSPDEPKPAINASGEVIRPEVFVQAGAFSSYNNADQLAASLKTLGEVTLSSIRVQGNNLFRVRVGPFKSMDEADMTLAKIVARGLNNARIVVD